MLSSVGEGMCKMYCKEVSMLPPELLDKPCLFFDFDGTLADTERFHSMARNSVLKKYGVRVWDWNRYIGKTDIEIFTEINKKFRIGYDILAVVEEKIKLSKELIILGKVEPFSSIDAIIETASGKKYVISKQREEFTSFFLQRWGLLKLFDKIISLAEETISKPDKIISMKIVAEDSVLFDDIMSVLEEATEKGFHTVLVKEGNLSLVLPKK